jgi:PAS domain S-box-containing protein
MDRFHALRRDLGLQLLVFYLLVIVPVLIAIFLFDWLISTRVADVETRVLIHRATLAMAGAFVLIGVLFWIALTRAVFSPIEQLVPISQAIGRNREITGKDRQQLILLSRRQDQIGRLIRAILRMEQSILARVNELTTLLETSEAVVSTLDSQTVLDRILEQVVRLLDVKMCAVVALDEKRDVFLIRASRGIPKEQADGLKILPSEPNSPTMQAMRTRQPVLVNDTESDPLFSSLRERARRIGYRTFLAMPLNTQLSPPAALLVYGPAPYQFSENEIQLLSSFANHAAMAIENAALYTRSDMRLQEQTRRIEALIESMHDGLVLGDLRGDVIYANRRMADLADLMDSEITGTPLLQILTRIIAKSNNPDEVRADVERALQSEEPRIAEIPIAENNHTIYLRMHVFDVTDAHNHPIGQGIILKDVSADRELDRMKSSLIGTVSHELRTPLASIKGYATTLLADDVEWDKESQREFLNIIVNESDRLTGLVNNLLDLNRLEAGSLRIIREPCDLEQIIEGATRSSNLQATNHLKISIQPNLPVLYADRQRLQTVLRNLIENAVKYAGAQAEINIQVKKAEGAIVFRVRDDGPGIPPEESQRVFESYYRVGGNLHMLTAGSGLGLAICQGFVRAHGGEIWVEPQIKGASIAFSLPLVHPEPVTEPIKLVQREQ